MPRRTEGPGLNTRSGIALYVQVAGILRHKVVSGDCFETDITLPLALVP